MSNFLNEAQLGVLIAAIGRRFDQVASIDPTEVAERMLADEEFRQKVMNAIAAIEFQLASNDQFGIAKGQQNNSPETWHRVSFINGLGSINRQALVDFIEQSIKAQVGSGGGGGGTGGGNITYQDIIRILGDIRLYGPDDLSIAANTGGHLTLQQATPEQYGVCKPRKNSPCYPQKTAWQTMNGTLTAQTKHDVHMFAPFSFPKEMPKRMEFFDRLTFIPIGTGQKCCTGCAGSGSGNGTHNPGTGGCDCKCPWNSDFRQDFTFNAYDSAKDFIQDFTVNTYDPAKDFIKDVTFDAKQTIDYTKTFSVEAIQTAPFTKDFTFDAKQTVDYTKTFSVEAIQPVPFTKNFSASVIQTAPFIKDFTMEVAAPSRWVNVTGSLPDWMRTVRFANNTFMIGCGGHSSSVNRMIDSTDGITWTPRAVPTNAQSGWWDSHAFGANTWVALNGQLSLPQTNPMAMTSPSGATWTTRTISHAAWSHVIFGNNQFVAVGNGFTTDGATWVAPYIATSPNGITWTNRTVTLSGATVNYLDNVAYGNGIYVATGAKRIDNQYHIPLTITSPDGINWTERSMPASLNGILGCVVFINNTFIALRGPWGSGRNLFTSTNGTIWTEKALPEDAMLYDIAYGNGVYVAVGNASDLLISSNMTTWTSEPSPPTYLAAKGFRSIAYGNGKFVAIRTNGDGIISSNF